MTLPRSKRSNPVAFTPWPVTVISSVVYLALLVPLLVIQHVVPPAPTANPTAIDLKEAWRDLQHLTRGFHPYNSHQNDEVHEWLLDRIGKILDTSSSTDADEERDSHSVERPDVFVFDDNQSNLTFSGGGVSNKSVTGVYFEGTNIIVYIRGSEDDTENWWDEPEGAPKGKGGVLVNAHYDSVSTGYGATDDGMAVVTLLQLLKYFTHPSHYPKKGLVLLFNNGEEDFLNGANVFSQHPLSRFTHTFLNLEGAGAGGRAALFRSTDTEVTEFYKNSKHPFGSVLAADAFKMGYLRSQTDYVVFDGILGLRGLDVAFIEPRARYHTDQDDVRHTSIDALWHMLSAALSTTQGLVSYTGTAFDGSQAEAEEGKVNSGTGTHGVWFDLFGSSFAVFRLHTLFAISVTLLVVTPLVLLMTSIILIKKDKMYLFSRYTSSTAGEAVVLNGFRGLFRYPVILVVSSVATVSLAYLLTKVNPFIIHSSPYAVWSMMISCWIFLAWFLSRIGDFARPSALHRIYSLTWLFVIMWILLVITTVNANRDSIAAGYFIMFYFAGTFLATWISYLEMFALPRKKDFANESTRTPEFSADDPSSRLLVPSASELPSDSHGGSTRASDDIEREEPTESTSLLGQQRTTFANYTRTRPYDHEEDESDDRTTGTTYAFGNEQQLSAKLPTWAWLLQFLFLAPIVIILVGQLGLFLTAAVYQVGADGVSTFVAYIIIAGFSILLLVPLSPFIHRFTYHVPTFLLLVFIGTLIYNLVAFPFSPENRLKVAFFQELNLDTGHNSVSLVGVAPYVQDIIAAIPSASSQEINCDFEPVAGRYQCSWESLPPNVAPNDHKDWVSYNITRSLSANQAKFNVSGKNTRGCKLKFDKPIRDYKVHGSAVDERIPHVAPGGISEIRLWSRTWDNTWSVDVEWDADADSVSEYIELEGKVICLWSDNNDLGVIPALDEIRQYAPAWAAITKLQDGLVEASYAFSV